MRRILTGDAGGGIVLMLAAVLALAAANSPMAAAYASFTHASHFAVNDFLMAIFFLFAGLEIRHELSVGALSSWRQASLPLVAAGCGMAVPALVYIALAPGYPAGWAVPAATDIAFALGVLALLGRRVPARLKVLLMAIAVIDDVGAIAVIVLFYSAGITLPWLGVVAACVAGLLAMKRWGVAPLAPYLAAGLVLWAALLQAGIHPTIGGVILAFCIPSRRAAGLAHKIAPYVAFGILPVFGFVNAGVSLGGMGAGDLLHPVSLGIGAGLVLGKVVGVSGALFACRRLGWPEGVRAPHIFGLGFLCGIGFTMALFIGGLAFPGDDMAAFVRMGVMGGSVLSGLLGYTVISFASGSRSTQGLSK